MESGLRAAADLAEDQRYVRDAAAGLGLCCICGRRQHPAPGFRCFGPAMQGAVPFRTPKELAVTLCLPHRGTITGMGIPRGVTLIVGGGYHGKSTLLKALELGVYDHVAGDGREFVITDATAVKIRAEDGPQHSRNGYLHVHQRPAQREGYYGL